MKISDDMLFSHPVLAEFSDDYTDGVFDFNLSQVRLDDETVVLEATLTLNCPDLEQLVRDGDAGTGFFLICPRTYFNRRFEMAHGARSFTVDASNFFRRTSVQPVVWSKKARKGWKSAYLHPEYGGGVDLPFAAVLAVGEEQVFTVDRAQSNHSRRSLRWPCPMTSHLANSGWTSIRGRSRSWQTRKQMLRSPGCDLGKSGRTLILNAVYLPVVADVIREVGMEPDQYADKPWYRIFRAKCDAAGIDMKNGNPLDAAQDLLNSPFLRFDESLGDMFQ